MFQCPACIVKCVRQPQYKYKNQIGKLWAEQKKKARAQNEEEKNCSTFNSMHAYDRNVYGADHPNRQQDHQEQKQVRHKQGTIHCLMNRDNFPL